MHKHIKTIIIATGKQISYHLAESAHTIRIHPVVNVSHTVPYYEQPADLQQEINDIPPPIDGLLGIEYEVDQVLNHRKRRNNYYFLEEWKGYPTSESSWEPKEIFLGSDNVPHEALSSYLEENSRDDEVVIF